MPFTILSVEQERYPSCVTCFALVHPDSYKANNNKCFRCKTEEDNQQQSSTLQEAIDAIEVLNQERELLYGGIIHIQDQLNVLKEIINKQEQ